MRVAHFMQGTIEAKLSDLDDLVIQFADTAVGDEFVGAWFNARKVVDLGRRAAKPAQTPPPAPIPAPAKL